LAWATTARHFRNATRQGTASDKPFRFTLVLSRVHWVRPELVAEVKYLTWTGNNLLRQVVYEGLREDKDPAEVCRPAPEPYRGPRPSKISDRSGLPSRRERKVARNQTKLNSGRFIAGKASARDAQISDPSPPNGKVLCGGGRLVLPTRIEVPCPLFDPRRKAFGSICRDALRFFNRTTFGQAIYSPARPIRASPRDCFL